MPPCDSTSKRTCPCNIQIEVTSSGRPNIFIKVQLVHPGLAATVPVFRLRVRRWEIMLVTLAASARAHDVIVLHAPGSSAAWAKVVKACLRSLALQTPPQARRTPFSRWKLATRSSLPCLLAGQQCSKGTGSTSCAAGCVLLIGPPASVMESSGCKASTGCMMHSTLECDTASSHCGQVCLTDSRILQRNHASATHALHGYAAQFESQVATAELGPTLKHIKLQHEMHPACPQAQCLVLLVHQCMFFALKPRRTLIFAAS